MIIELMMFLVFFGFMFFVVWKVIFGGRGGITNPMEFQKLKKTLDDDLKDRLNQHGDSGDHYYLYLGAKRIAKIDKFRVVNNTESDAEFDPKTKRILVGTTTKTDKFMILRTFSPSIISRAFGVGKRYYVLSVGKADKPTYHIDHSGKKIIFPYFMDIISYGRVWVNSTAGADYLQSISIKRMLEQTQMYLENIPDKTILLENDIARKERLLRTNIDLEKGRYEESKLTGETKIE